jgi:hypothetical protein
MRQKKVRLKSSTFVLMTLQKIRALYPQADAEKIGTLKIINSVKTKCYFFKKAKK